MKNMTLIVVVLVGLFGVVNSACNTTIAVDCASEFSKASSSAGTDVSKNCEAYKSYISCLTDGGCDKDPNYKTVVETGQTYINQRCGTTMLTASIATMILTLFAVMFK